MKGALLVSITQSILVLAESVEMEFSAIFTSVPQNDQDYSQTGVYGIYKDFDNIEID